ncbi:hypothetical protein EW145_g2809 [Phellinidium pouzarii]|uniref:Transcription factor TFIIIC triple barrel domain-containing protein n=1 Tax=Phellinidium pouzarii TaxID=167371 RepID=A0A4S4LBE1_9AGAM|nr:hypothetical protein EW145_g2809 [Phellinidium pouzarii]
MSSSSNSTTTPTQSGLLFPGFKHVEAFGPDEDYEEEVEECYVTLDMSNVAQTLVPSSTSYRLIGLDTPTPFLQLSGTIMKGRHQTLLGTELIFEETTGENERPSQDNVQYFTSTERRILFREVELKPKAPAQQTGPLNPDFISGDTLAEGNTTGLKSSYIEAAGAFDQSLQTPEGESTNPDINSGLAGSAASHAAPLQSESIEHAMEVDE